MPSSIRSYIDAVCESVNASNFASFMGATPVSGSFFHYTVAIDEFSSFRLGNRGVVYLSTTRGGAIRGGEAGQNERGMRADDDTVWRNPEDRPRLLTVSAVDLLIYGEHLPIEVTWGREEEIHQFADSLPPRSRELALAVLLERPTAFDRRTERFMDEMQAKYGSNWDQGNLTPAELARYQHEARRVYQTDQLRPMSDTAAEQHEIQDAVRNLGYNTVRVTDEGGTSLAVLDPSRLSIVDVTPLAWPDVTRALMGRGEDGVVQGL